MGFSKFHSDTGRIPLQIISTHTQIKTKPLEHHLGLMMMTFAFEVEIAYKLPENHRLGVVGALPDIIRTLTGVGGVG